MKILEQIIQQLTDALPLNENFRVAALLEDDNIMGWQIVEFNPEIEDLIPISKPFENIKELINQYYTLI